MAWLRKRGWDFWKHIDFFWIDVCDGVWVLVPHEGIDKIHKSKGVNEEIAYAEEIGIPVKYVTIKKGQLVAYEKTSI